MSNTAFPLNDVLDVQSLIETQNDVGEEETWQTTFHGIFAGVAPLYDNVNSQTWGNVHSHNIYRVVMRAVTAIIINVTFEKTRFIWTNLAGHTKILRPIEDIEFPGRTPKKWGYVRCEDITTYSPKTNP